MAKFGGWAGKTLRVDLSSRKITVEDTVEKYKDYLGGTGVAYKVMWDEVPAGTKGFDEANKLIFGGILDLRAFRIDVDRPIDVRRRVPLELLALLVQTHELLVAYLVVPS